MRERTTVWHVLAVLFFVLFWGAVISYDTRHGAKVHAAPPADHPSVESVQTQRRAFVKANPVVRVIDTGYTAKNHGATSGPYLKFVLLEGWTTRERALISGIVGPEEYFDDRSTHIEGLAPGDVVRPRIDERGTLKCERVIAERLGAPDSAPTKRNARYEVEVHTVVEEPAPPGISQRKILKRPVIGGVLSVTEPVVTYDKAAKVYEVRITTPEGEEKIVKSATEPVVRKTGD